MKRLQTFNFSDQPVKVFVDQNNNPWWCAPDVCRILGYSNGRDALTKHCKEKGVAKYDTLLQKGGMQTITYIDESNLYRLIMRCNLQSAEIFQDWVTSEVLPQIRKTGSYGVKELSRLEILQLALKAEEDLQAANSKLIEQAPKVALADACLTAKNNITFTQLCKSINVHRNLFTEHLRKEKILYLHRGENLPNQQYVDKGFFVTRIKPVEHSDRFENHTQTLVTPAGIQFLKEIIDSLPLNSKVRVKV